MLHQSCSLIAFQLHFDCMKLLHFDCIFITLHLDCKNIAFRLHFHYMTFGLHFDCTTIAMLQSQCNKSAIKVQSISLQSWCNPTAFRVQSKCNVFFLQSCGNPVATKVQRFATSVLWKCHFCQLCKYPCHVLEAFANI